MYEIILLNNYDDFNRCASSYIANCGRRLVRTTLFFSLAAGAHRNEFQKENWGAPVFGPLFFFERDRFNCFAFRTQPSYTTSTSIYNTAFLPRETQKIHNRNFVGSSRGHSIWEWWMRGVTCAHLCHTTSSGGVTFSGRLHHGVQLDRFRACFMGNEVFGKIWAGFFFFSPFSPFASGEKRPGHIQTSTTTPPTIPGERGANRQQTTVRPSPTPTVHHRRRHHLPIYSTTLVLSSSILASSIGGLGYRKETSSGVLLIHFLLCFACFSWTFVFLLAGTFGKQEVGDLDHQKKSF